MRRRSLRHRVVAFGAAAAVSGAAAFGFLAGPSAFAAVNPAEGQIRSAGGPTAVNGSYIVVLKDKPVSTTAVARTTAVAASARKLAKRHGGAVGQQYSAALTGFAVQMSEREARRLAADPEVQFVEQSHIARAADTQFDPPSYGLDRIDQANLPLDRSYTYPNNATDVTTYVIDTGIRLSHNDLGGRPGGFFDFEGGNGDDCHGHGTSMAATIAGARYGVAKNAFPASIRVLNCAAMGSTADILAGIDYVTRNAIKPAVANMSFVFDGIVPSLDEAVARLIASGVTVVVAGGNYGTDACNYSPARVPAAIAVGATDRDDNRAWFSNVGSCVDIFAPGVDIVSAWKDSDDAVATRSGTSPAAAHVTGAAALILQANPGFTPEQVSQRLFDTAAYGVVRDPGPGSPNRLLQVSG